MTMSLITVKDGAELFSSPSLQDICIRFCVTNAQTLLLTSSSPTKSSLQSKKQHVKLQKSVNLPNDIWEKLLENFDSLSEDYLPLVHAVHHKVPLLRKIHIRNSPHLSDDQLCLLLENFPVSLDIHNCPSLTKKSMEFINKFGKNLECLCIGTSTQIMPINVDNWIASHKKEDDEEGIKNITKTIRRFFKGKFTASAAAEAIKNDERKGTNKPHGLFTTPKLRKLVIWGLHITQVQKVRYKTLGLQQTSLEEETAGEASNNINVNGDARMTPTRATEEDVVEAPATGTTKNMDYWEYVTRDFIENLEYLDLSSCHEIVDLRFLLPAKSTLISLLVHDVLLDYDEETWGVLIHLRKLKFLDVSQYNELASVFANPNVILSKMVCSLPDLAGLDISGTNLAGFDYNLTPLAIPTPTSSSIIGLALRKQKPLAFLGLLSTHYNASNRPNIPALQIAGGSTIPQLILALKLYLPRDNILRKAVRILHERLTATHSSDFIPFYTILDILLDVMSTHMDDKHTIIVSLAALFHVLKKIFTGTIKNGSSAAAELMAEPSNISQFRVNKAFHVIVRAMEVHSHDMSLMRNGVLNILLLTSRLNMNAHYAKKLVPVILNAGVTVISQSSDIFMVKAIAHVLYTVTHFEDQYIMEMLLGIHALKQLCAFMLELFNKRVLNQMPTFWIILLKFTKQCRDEDPNFYLQFTDSGFIEVSFKLFKICNEVRDEGNEEEEVNEIRALREIQKPVLAFLTNMLYNTSLSTETSIIESTQIRLAFSILQGKKSRADHELLHVCCGFLAHVCNKDESSKLVNPSREEILLGIFRVMSHMDRKNKFNFTFRNLNQLYDLLTVHTPPEIHLWALWTLVKLAEDDESFVDIIIRDGTLNLNTFRQHYESTVENGGRCIWAWKLELLCDHLSNMIDKRYAVLQEESTM